MVMNNQSQAPAPAPAFGTPEYTEWYYNNPNGPGYNPNRDNTVSVDRTTGQVTVTNTNTGESTVTGRVTVAQNEQGSFTPSTKEQPQDNLTEEDYRRLESIPNRGQDADDLQRKLYEINQNIGKGKLKMEESQKASVKAYQDYSGSMKNLPKDYTYREYYLALTADAVRARQAEKEAGGEVHTVDWWMAQISATSKEDDKTLADHYQAETGKKPSFKLPDVPKTAKPLPQGADKWTEDDYRKWESISKSDTAENRKRQFEFYQDKGLIPKDAVFVDNVVSSEYGWSYAVAGKSGDKELSGKQMAELAQVDGASYYKKLAEYGVISDDEADLQINPGNWVKLGDGSYMKKSDFNDMKDYQKDIALKYGYEDLSNNIKQEQSLIAAYNQYVGDFEKNNHIISNKGDTQIGIPIDQWNKMDKKYQDIAESKGYDAMVNAMLDDGITVNGESRKRYADYLINTSIEGNKYRLAVLQAKSDKSTTDTQIRIEDIPESALAKVPKGAVIFGYTPSTGEVNYQTRQAFQDEANKTNYLTKPASGDYNPIHILQSKAQSPKNVIPAVGAFVTTAEPTFNAEMQNFKGLPPQAQKVAAVIVALSAAGVTAYELAKAKKSLSSGAPVIVSADQYAYVLMPENGKVMAFSLQSKPIKGLQGDMPLNPNIPKSIPGTSIKPNIPKLPATSVKPNIPQLGGMSIKPDIPKTGGGDMPTWTHDAEDSYLKAVVTTIDKNKTAADWDKALAEAERQHGVNILNAIKPTAAGYARLNKYMSEVDPNPPPEVIIRKLNPKVDYNKIHQQWVSELDRISAVGAERIKQNAAEREYENAATLSIADIKRIATNKDWERVRDYYAQYGLENALKQAILTDARHQYIASLSPEALPHGFSKEYLYVLAAEKIISDIKSSPKISSKNKLKLITYIKHDLASDLSVKQMAKLKEQIQSQLKTSTNSQTRSQLKEALNTLTNLQEQTKSQTKTNTKVQTQPKTAEKTQTQEMTNEAANEATTTDEMTDTFENVREYENVKENEKINEKVNIKTLTLEKEGKQPEKDKKPPKLKKGSLIWKQGALDVDKSKPGAEPVFKYAQPPDYQVKTVFKKPQGYRGVGRTPQQTLQVLGGRVTRKVSVDMGVTRATANPDNKQITFSRNKPISDQMPAISRRTRGLSRKFPRISSRVGKLR